MESHGLHGRSIPLAAVIKPLKGCTAQVPLGWSCRCPTRAWDKDFTSALRGPVPFPSKHPCCTVPNRLLFS